MPPRLDDYDGASSHAFGNIYILPPSGMHYNTVIFLHGRGSTGREFCEDLSQGVMSNLRTLQNALRCRGFRLVFPTARLVFSRGLTEWTPAWLEEFFYDLDQLDVDQHDMVTQNIVDGTEFLHNLIVEETNRLRGNARKLFIVGYSDGGSIGLWTLLTLPPAVQALGGFIGINTTLPFGPSIKRHMRGEVGLPRPNDPYEEQRCRQDEFVTDKLTMILRPIRRGSPEPPPRVCRTPILMMHGVNNKIVDINLAEEALITLGTMGFATQWFTYTGEEEDAHWITEPEGFDDIFRFIVGSYH